MAEKRCWECGIGEEGVGKEDLKKWGGEWMCSECRGIWDREAAAETALINGDPEPWNQLLRDDDAAIRRMLET